MRKTVAAFALANLLASPVAAAASSFDPGDVLPGGFVGARLKLPLGHSTASPRAELAFAPTQSRISSSGQIRTQIGEGLAFGFSAKSKPTLTIAGTRPDAALRLQRGRQTSDDSKLGISSGGWVAIGVGVVALAAGVYFVHLVHEADKNSD